MKYICTDETCNYEGSGCYTIDLNGEACMDSNNIASIFCPYCQNIMQHEEDVNLVREEGAMKIPA